MRSLSMRIANPHLIPKKSRFGYPTKKIKIKTKSNIVCETTSKIETDQAIKPDQESTSLLAQVDSSNIPKPKKADKLIIIEEDSKSFTK